MMTIRNGVRENALISTVIDAEDYRQAMFRDGRAWVCEADGAVVGFSCGRTVQGDVWALFVDRGYEGRGIGSGLMDRVEAWMFDQGVTEIWLVTAPGTRAERLYQRRGWHALGLQPSGEMKFRLRPPADRT